MNIMFNLCTNNLKQFKKYGNERIDKSSKINPESPIG